MKFVYLLAICVLGMAAMASAQGNNKFQFTPQNNRPNLPTLTGSGGGSYKRGVDLNLDVNQRVWQSQSGRHSIDASVGYSQHLGGPYGNSPADKRGSVGYTYRFG